MTPSRPTAPTLTLAAALADLEAVAPLRLAAGWDNVGLLLEPPQRPRATGTVERVLLTIDLTEAVVEEALDGRVDLIVAYHPLIFDGVRSLTLATAQGRSLLRLANAGVALYSPHTALDAARGGVNDWLLGAFGGSTNAVPLEPDAVTPEQGAGRVADLDQPRGLPALVQAIKAHLSLSHVRVAAASEHAAGVLVRSVAVCPGAGGSLFAGLLGPDLLLTGEMRHHDVLAHVARGVSVVLTDHTNTERGYLPVLAERLQGTVWAGAVEVAVAGRDRDPLTIV